MAVMLSATEWMGITAMRLNKWAYLIREGFRSIGTHGFMSFATVTIIMACLIIMGSVSLLSVNIDALIKDLEDENEVVAFIDENLDEEQAKAVCDAIGALHNISSVEFVSREAAMENFMGRYEDDLREGIDAGVFRHRCIVKLVDIALMESTQASLEAVEGVAKVNAHIEYANMFITIRNIISIVSLVLIAMLVFVSFFIMSNTIKLATFGRREEIAIMKMVGASNAFIRMPFVIEGLVLGIVGGGLAFLAEWGIYELLTTKIMGGITGNILSVVPFQSLAMTVFVAFISAGVLVGAFGGVNAIKNYLKV